MVQSEELMLNTYYDQFFCSVDDFLVFSPYTIEAMKVEVDA